MDSQVTETNAILLLDTWFYEYPREITTGIILNPSSNICNGPNNNSSLCGRQVTRSSIPITTPIFSAK